MRRLEEDQRRRHLRRLCNRAAPLAPFRRQEATEVEAVGRQARQGQRHRHGRGAGRRGHGGGRRATAARTRR